MGAQIFNTLEDSNGIYYIDRLLNHQKIQKESGNKLEHFLILLDDWITHRSLNKKGAGIYGMLFSMARHFNISIIITGQSYSQVPSTVRRLAWYSLIFKISNRAEKKIMIHEQSENVDMNEIEFEKFIMSVLLTHLVLSILTLR